MSFCCCCSFASRQIQKQKLTKVFVLLSLGGSLSISLSVCKIFPFAFASVQDITRTMPPNKTLKECRDSLCTKPTVLLLLLLSSYWHIFFSSRSRRRIRYISPPQFTHKVLWKQETTIICRAKRKQNRVKQNSPLAFSNSGTTKSVRSGSSPYQKIHSSLAAVNESGGCTLASLLILATRRHTHRMSAARHREYDRSTGSSNGSLDALGRSFETSFRHLIPHRSVCKRRKETGISQLLCSME